MPAFNISCTHKYLVVNGITKWTKTNSFSDAKRLAVNDGDNIYEHVGKPGDWYILASNYEGKIISEILGDLPND